MIKKKLCSLRVTIISLATALVFVIHNGFIQNVSKTSTTYTPPERQLNSTCPMGNPSKSTKPSIVFFTLPWKGFNLDFKKHLCQQNCDCDIILAEYLWKDQSLLESADAIIFHPLSQDWQLQSAYPIQTSKFQSFRKPEQLYVFFQWESPYYHRDIDLSDYKNFFNITMTYRLDSTIPWPYGSIGKSKIYEYRYNRPGHWNFEGLNKNSADSHFSKSIQRNRTRGVVVVMSLCRGDYRIEIIKKLNQLLPKGSLEVYGKCAKELQPEGLQNPNPALCTDSRIDVNLVEVLREYKFYIAIENSFCIDYITEKFFINAIQAGIVPIVGGLPRKAYEKFIPSDGFIHTDDFESITQLAAYIERFLHSRSSFEKFFEWRNWTIHPGMFVGGTIDEHYELGLCGLCKKVREVKESGNISRNIVENVHAWWYGGEEKILVCAGNN